MAGPTAEAIVEVEGVTGAEKAAILLLSIDPAKAKEILAELSDRDIQKVTNYAARLSEVSTQQINAVKQEFHGLLASNNPLSMGQTKEQMKDLLSSVLPAERVEEITEFLEGSMEVTDGLESLKWLDPQTIGSFLRNEHPHSIALILAYLEPSQASAVLGQISQRLQPDVIQRLAVLDRISPAIVYELNEVLRAELLASGATKSSHVGGIESAAEIMNRMEKAVETNVFTRLDEVNPSLADEIRELMFVFEDLGGIEDRDMQQIMREVGNEQLVLALKSAGDELKAKIFKNISSRAAEMITEELEVMGPVKLTDVEAAQQEIVKIARRLEGEGKITLGGAAGGDSFV